MIQENAILAAANAVLSNFTQQIVEQATTPLINRIATLERQQEELYEIIKVSLNELINNAVKHAFESPEHTIWISVFKANVLDEVDHKVSNALKSVGSIDIKRIEQLVDQHLQNQPTIDADDISGLKNFVRDVVEGVHSDSIEADDIDGLDKFVRDVIDEVSEDDDSVTEKVKEALRAAADSI